MIRILAIGNSFSQDAAAYLHDIAKADGTELKIVNLYIGGCSLKTHWQNIEEDAAAYDYELNGQYTGRKISIREALLEDTWDYVTLQQVSGNSGIAETYYPFIKDISAYVQKLVPRAIQLLHQTWAYEVDSDHPDFHNYDCDQQKMYEAITAAYQTAANDLFIGIIPSGRIIQTLRKQPVFDYKNGGISLCRDGFHMNLIYGRYAVAATWYEFLLNKSILSNSYFPPEFNGLRASENEIGMIKEIVHQELAKSE
jgi:hypothetical protein